MGKPQIVMAFVSCNLRRCGPKQKSFYACGHVHQAWLKQACIKIKDGPTHVVALKSFGEIMYNTDCPKDQEMDASRKNLS